MTINIIIFFLYTTPRKLLNLLFVHEKNMSQFIELYMHELYVPNYDFMNYLMWQSILFECNLIKNKMIMSLETELTEWIHDEAQLTYFNLYVYIHKNSWKEKEEINQKNITN